MTLAQSAYSSFGKRGLDIGAAVAGSILLFPVIAAASLAIRLDSPGSILYRQERIGRNGQEFQIIKFRSMLPIESSYDAEGNPLANEARVTRVGRLLRQTSIDELPQLLNVLRGEMSLVGPRPTLRYQVERYDADQRRRLDVRPGLTGLAQVSGRNSLSWDEKIRLDVEYVDRASFLLDLKIILRTFGVVLKGKATEFSQHDLLSRHAKDYRDDI